MQHFVFIFPDNERQFSRGTGEQCGNDAGQKLVNDPDQNIRRRQVGERVAVGGAEHVADVDQAEHAGRLHQHKVVELPRAERQADVWPRQGLRREEEGFALKDDAVERHEEDQGVLDPVERYLSRQVETVRDREEEAEGGAVRQVDDGAEGDGVGHAGSEQPDPDDRDHLARVQHVDEGARGQLEAQLDAEDQGQQDGQLGSSRGGTRQR